MVSLSTTYKEVYDDINRLLDLHSNIGGLEPKYSKLVAEIELLRLFDMLVDVIASAAIKIVCGAFYVDGSQPSVLLHSRSRTSALQNMMTAGRPKPRILRWTEVDEIKKNLTYVLDPSEHFINILDSHALLINEMRIIRNRIAHNNEASRRNYKKVILRYYGAELNPISPGILLLSPRQKPPLITKYFMQSRALIKTLLKA